MQPNKLDLRIADLLDRGLTPQQVFDVLSRTLGVGQRGYLSQLFGYQASPQQLAASINRLAQERVVQQSTQAQAQADALARFLKRRPERIPRTPTQIDDYLSQTTDLADLQDRLNDLLEWGVLTPSAAEAKAGLTPEALAERYGNDYARWAEQNEAQTQAVNQYQTGLRNQYAPSLQGWTDYGDLANRINGLRDANGNVLDQETKAQLWDVMTPVGNFTQGQDLSAQQRSAEAATRANAMNLQTQNNLARTRADQALANNQRIERNYAAIGAFVNPADVLPPWQPKPLPGLEGPANEFLKQYAPGSRLAEFVRQGIGQVAQDTAQARQNWWEANNPAPVDTRSRQQRLQGQADYLTGLMPNLSAEGVNGPGDKSWRDVAQASIDSLMQEIAGLGPEDFIPNEQPQPAGGEDPFTAALKQKNWWADFARQRGVANNPRLTPAVRYR